MAVDVTDIVIHGPAGVGGAKHPVVVVVSPVCEPRAWGTGCQWNHLYTYDGVTDGVYHFLRDVSRHSTDAWAGALTPAQEPEDGEHRGYLRRKKKGGGKKEEGGGGNSAGNLFRGGGGRRAAFGGGREEEGGKGGKERRGWRGATEEMIICGGFAPAFPFPRTKPTDFTKIQVGDGAMRQNLVRASELRKALDQALKSKDAAQVADAADAYLPFAVGIWRAMEQGQTKDGRSLSFGLAFEWTSFTFRKPEKSFTLYSLRFEVMMVLICRMIAAGNTGASLLEAVQSPAEYETTAKAALQHVKTAAGIGTFVANEIQPLKEVLPFERPAEVHRDLMSCIVILYQAAGQSIACRQAQNKGMSQQLVAKLFAAAAKLMASANLLLQGDSLKNDYKDLAPPLKCWVDGGSKLLKAVALQYVAEAAHRYVSREAMHCYCT